MKLKLFLIAFLAFNILTTNAQLYKKKIKITLKNGEILKGYAKKKSKTIHLFKSYESKEKKIVELKNVEKIAFLFKEGYQDFHYLSKKGQSKRRLLKPLIIGDISLYKSFGQQKIGQINNEVDLSYMISTDGKIYRTFKNFRKEAKELFKDCDIILKRIKSRQYSRIDIAEMIVIHNNGCKEELDEEEEIVKKEPVVKEKPIVVTKPKEIIKPKVIVSKPKEVITKPLPKDFIKIKDKIALNINPIYFTLDKAEIRDDAFFELDKVVILMLENPFLKIEIGSHTDSRGSDNYNSKLSADRANKTLQYILEKGISASRITAVGYGETKLMNHCKNKVDCTEQEHQQNRRTEFVILNPDIIKY